MGMIKVRDGTKIRKGAGSSMREILPGDPILRSGWFVGGTTLENLKNKTRKNVSGADVKKKDFRDKLGR